MNEMKDTGPLLDLALDVEVWLASERITLRRLMALQPGQELQLSKDPDEPLDLVVNGTIVANGELVIVDDHFGFRVTRTAQQRLATLGPEAISEAASEPVPDSPADSEVTP